MDSSRSNVKLRVKLIIVASDNIAKFCLVTAQYANSLINVALNNNFSANDIALWLVVKGSPLKAHDAMLIRM